MTGGRIESIEQFARAGRSAGRSVEEGAASNGASRPSGTRQTKRGRATPVDETTPSERWVRGETAGVDSGPAGDGDLPAEVPRRAARRGASKALQGQHFGSSTDKRSLGGGGTSLSGVDWQKLWLSTQSRPWTSLALVTVGNRIDSRRVAEVLAGVGERHLGPVFQVVDATSITLEVLRGSMGACSQRSGTGGRVVLALGPVLEWPPSLALAQAADAVILCLALGESSISEAARTVDAVGKGRFLGSVIFRKSQGQR